MRGLGGRLVSGDLPYAYIHRPALATAGSINREQNDIVTRLVLEKSRKAQAGPSGQPGGGWPGRAAPASITRLRLPA